MSPVRSKKTTKAKTTKAKAGSAAERLIQDFHKRYGDTVGGLGVKIRPPDRVLTGVPQIDVALGGGIPRGRITIGWGDKDVGKSTLLYKLIDTFLRNHPDQIAVLQDIEGNYDSEYGSKFGLDGIDESRLLFLQPDTAEDACDMMLQVIHDLPDKVGLIGVDSLAAMVPSKEAEEDSVGDAHMALAGRLIGKFVRRCSHELNIARKNGHAPTMFMLNQVRTAIGKMHGDPASMPGGKGVGHHASTILRLRGGKESGEGKSARPYLKEVRGVIEKKKGPVLSRNFEYTMAIEALEGMRVGDVTGDWRFVASHLEDAGLLSKKEGKGKATGWILMDQEFRVLKDAQAWYEEHRSECVSAVIDHLFKHPEDVGTA